MLGKEIVNGAGTYLFLFFWSTVVYLTALFIEESSKALLHFRRYSRLVVCLSVKSHCFYFSLSLSVCSTVCQNHNHEQKMWER